MPEPYTEPLPVQPSSFKLKDLIASLFRRKGLVLTLFASITGLVTLVTFLMPRQYESHMKVLVKNERADLVVSPDSRQGSEVHSDISEQQVNSEIELLNSTDLLARVVRTCRLYEHNSGTVQASSEPTPEAFERAVRNLSRNLKITAVRKASIIQVSYSASTPELAAAVLRELSAAYLDAHLSVHRTPGTQAFFRKQAERYQSELHDAETRLAEFRRRNNLTSIAEQKELVLRKRMDAESDLRQTSTALAETITRINELRRQIASLNPRIVTQNRVLPNQYSVERLNTMLAELENRRTQALMKFQNGDRIITEIDEEIANTRAALDRAARLSATEEATDVNPLRQSLEADLARAELQQTELKTRSESFARTLADYRARLASLEQGTIEDDTLARAVKESEENYLLYTKKQEEARIDDSLDQQKIANVAIAEAPAEQHLPAKPNEFLNLSLGVVLATFVSVGAALGADYSSHRFHTPADLESITGLPVLATVPYE